MLRSILYEKTEASILGRLIRPKKSDLSPAAARAILRLDFGPRDRQRMHRLVVKNQEGLLTKTEQNELESYCRVGLFLDLMRSKARLSLKQSASRS